MNLNNLYDSIENMTDAADRCIAYSEVILYLKALKETISFPPQEIGWKDIINNQLLRDIRKELDIKVDEVRAFIEFNVKH